MPFTFHIIFSFSFLEKVIAHNKTNNNKKGTNSIHPLFKTIHLQVSYSPSSSHAISKLKLNTPKMRSLGYTLHHFLTMEAAAIVKQAVTLARRRGHAQVSPLHVASSMLASPAGLLKRACLEFHSHPLQCKALELCFNVALNRLPSSASSPLLGPPSHPPSLSNALVAAFKRAQAHQRRGSLENHHQPILNLKVEIEQLVISILDDPSVSRVMREAAFSSTQVKSHIQTQTQTQTPPTADQSTEKVNLSQFRSKEAKKLHDNDVTSVLEAMASKKTKNTVIVGECASTNEKLVKKVIEKFDKKDVPDEMKTMQFISVPLFTLRNISKQEFEVKLAELRSLVKSYVGRGIVLYLGDLDWVSEFWSKHIEQRNLYHSHVECMIMELSRLVSTTEENHKSIWLMGIATSQTYNKCRTGRPSLETLWSLHPLTLPFNGLALGLSLDTMHDDQVKREPLDVDNVGIINEQLACCLECAENFNKEVEGVMREWSSSSSSRLPSWLCKKWNSICSSVHKKLHFLEKGLSYSSPSSTSVSSNDQNKSKIIQQSLLNWPAIFEDEVSKPELLSNPNSSPNPASSSAESEDMKQNSDEMNLDNLEILTAALEEKVPWQKHIIPEIVTAILKCRSMRRESKLCFLGPDDNGKEMMAKELANIIFGSSDEFVSISMSSFSSTTRADSEDDMESKKRVRNEHGGSVYDRFLEAVRDNPSRVVYIENVDKLNRRCLKRFERAMGNDSESLLLKDAIIIFSKNEKDEDKNNDEKHRGSLDLNLNRACVANIDTRCFTLMTWHTSGVLTVSHCPTLFGRNPVSRADRW